MYIAISPVLAGAIYRLLGAEANFTILTVYVTQLYKFQKVSDFAFTFCLITVGPT